MNMVAFNRFTGLNPFEVREVSKLNWFGKHAWFYVLIPLRSGKFLNKGISLSHGLNVLIPLRSGKFLNRYA